MNCYGTEIAKLSATTPAPTATHRSPRAEAADYLATLRRAQMVPPADARRHLPFPIRPKRPAPCPRTNAARRPSPYSPKRCHRDQTRTKPLEPMRPRVAAWGLTPELSRHHEVAFGLNELLGPGCDSPEPASGGRQPTGNSPQAQMVPPLGRRRHPLFQACRSDRRPTRGPIAVRPYPRTNRSGATAISAGRTHWGNAPANCCVGPNA